jgi:polysaccharide export outer membrane protein
MLLSRGSDRHGGGKSLWGVLCLGTFCVILLSAFAAAALSQTSSVSRGYRIVAGDFLQIDVVGRTDLSGQFSVDKEGVLTLPIIGGVNATGRTTTELGTDISRRISLISRDVPEVTVSVLQTYRRKNFVLGAVLLPGSYTFAKSPTVWEAISEAGGPSEDSDLSAVQVLSEAQFTPSIVDIAAAVRSGDLASLPRLHPGDTVRVPRAAGVKGAVGDVVYVFGAVATQGPMPLSEASDLVRALIRCGPALDANLSHVEIVRRSGPRVVSMTINMRDYVGKASLVGNPELQAGDTVYLTRKAPVLDSGFLRVAGAVMGLAVSIVILTR